MYKIKNVTYVLEKGALEYLEYNFGRHSYIDKINSLLPEMDILDLDKLDVMTTFVKALTMKTYNQGLGELNKLLNMNPSNFSQGLQNLDINFSQLSNNLDTNLNDLLKVNQMINTDNNHINIQNNLNQYLNVTKSTLNGSKQSLSNIYGLIQNLMNYVYSLQTNISTIPNIGAWINNELENPKYYLFFIKGRLIVLNYGKKIDTIEIGRVLKMPGINQDDMEILKVDINKHKYLEYFTKEMKSTFCLKLNRLTYEVDKNLFFGKLFKYKGASLMNKSIVFNNSGDRLEMKVNPSRIGLNMEIYDSNHEKEVIEYVYKLVNKIYPDLMNQ